MFPAKTYYSLINEGKNSGNHFYTSGWEIYVKILVPFTIFNIHKYPDILLSKYLKWGILNIKKFKSQSWMGILKLFHAIKHAGKCYRYIQIILCSFVYIYVYSTITFEQSIR